MTRQQAYLVAQAKVLAREPDTTGLLDSVRSMPCKVNVPYRCRHGHGFPIADPDSRGRLPVAACYSCFSYIESAFHLDPESADAHCRIKMARADTYDALLERGDLVKAIRD